jgi:hypothetical protein
VTIFPTLKKKNGNKAKRQEGNVQVFVYPAMIFSCGYNFLYCPSCLFALFPFFFFSVGKIVTFVCNFFGGESASCSSYDVTAKKKRSK